MMLFKPEHVVPILAGTKTQTRRIWKKKRANVGSVHLAKLQMLSKDFFAKFAIQDVYQERLIDISDEDARAEGYENAAKYLDAFYKINKIDANPNLIVWVVKFQVMP